MGLIGLLLVIRQTQTIFPSLMALTALPKLDTNLVCSTICMPKDSLPFSSRFPIEYLAITAAWIGDKPEIKSVIPDEKNAQRSSAVSFGEIISVGSDITSPEISDKTMKGIDLELPSFKPRIELSVLLI